MAGQGKRSLGMWHLNQDLMTKRSQLCEDLGGTFLTEVLADAKVLTLEWAFACLGSERWKAGAPGLEENKARADHEEGARSLRTLSSSERIWLYPAFSSLIWSENSPSRTRCRFTIIYQYATELVCKTQPKSFIAFRIFASSWGDLCSSRGLFHQNKALK